MKEFWPYSDVATDDISIYDGPKPFLKAFRTVSTPEQIAFAGYWLQAEVLNGGLTQFFSNDTGVLAPEAVEACRTAGLPKLAARIEEAMKWFGQSYPKEGNKREARLEKEGRDPFEAMDDEVTNLIYEENSGLEQAVIRYIESLSGREHR